MNQNDSSGFLIKPWPVLLDHFKLNYGLTLPDLSTYYPYKLFKRNSLRVVCVALGV